MTDDGKKVNDPSGLVFFTVHGSGKSETYGKFIWVVSKV